ncbi:MAG: type II secretion system protein [Chlorobi bacterium]|nr:type II secretion system protein [Chlorobiota bacterium]
MFTIKENNRIKAFTLSELLVVLVIIGILVLLALPSLMPLISKAHSTEAQLQLGQVHLLEKNYFYLHSKYTKDLDEIGFEQVKLVTEGGSAKYKIEVIEATTNAFKAKATAVVDFDGDGVFDIWEIDENKNLKEITKD